MGTKRAEVVMTIHLYWGIIDATLWSDFSVQRRRARRTTCRYCKDVSRRDRDHGPHRNTVEIDALFFFPSPAMSSPIFWSRHCGVPAQYSPWVKAKALIPSCPGEVQVVVRWDAMQKSEAETSYLRKQRHYIHGDRRHATPTPDLRPDTRPEWTRLAMPRPFPCYTPPVIQSTRIFPQALKQDI
ncbi:hypothetical protein BGY98DRAFT_148700 [Russula aff. rugulosa BPL654]|nr:hypothetical protein BGY98DRAFT_148700 [Russula aff. rugulosa BPL654]